MATVQKVTAGKILSAVIQYSNKDDESRAYDITADVKIQNKKVSAFDNGEVRIITDSPIVEGTNSIATFGSYNTKSLSLFILDAAQTEAEVITTAIYNFMADVRESVTDNPSAV